MTRRHKKTSALSTSIKPVCAATLLALFTLYGNQAQACGTIAAGSYSTRLACTPSSGDAAISIVNGTTINVSGNSSALDAWSRTGNATVTLSGGTVALTNSNINYYAINSYLYSGAVGAATVVFDGGVNTVTADSTINTAILAWSASSSGTASIIVTDGTVLNVTNTAVGNERDALEATSTGAKGTDVSIIHRGSGTLMTLGGDGALLKTKDSGSALADIGSGVNIVVDNTSASSASSQHAGIFITAGDGVVQATSAANIEAKGANALGIYAKNGAASNTIINSGDITAGGTGIYANSKGAISIANGGAIQTNGENAHGIQGLSTGGAVTIDNQSAITATGNGVRGISAQGTGKVSVINNGAIAAQGSNIFGIFAHQSSSTSAASIEVENHASITLTGIEGVVGTNRAIQAYTNGSGDVTITGSGDINQINAVDNISHAIIAKSREGVTKVDYSGNITTHGVDASGIRAEAILGGDVIVNYTGSRIETFNGNADAIYAYSRGGSGNVYVTVAGELITHAGVDSSFPHGSDFGVAAMSNGGNVNVHFTGTKIDVDGTGSAALYADSVMSGAGAGSIAIINDNRGSLITRGEGGSGLLARSKSGNQTLMNNGTIDIYNNSIFTHGDVRGKGIDALSTSGAISVDNSGAITTRGTDSHGIFAFSESGELSVTNAAAVATGGAQAYGIYSETGDVGSVAVANSGNIATQGEEGSGGILAIANGSGNAVVSSTGADVTTNGTGIGNHGLEAKALNGLAKVTVNSGTVSVSGQSAGLIASNDNSGLASSAEVNVNGATVDATRTHDQFAIRSVANDSSLIAIDAGSAVHGGWGDTAAVSGAILIGGAEQTLNNDGRIDALSDQAVYSDSGNAWRFNNRGVVTGAINVDTAAATFDNAGTWNLRSFADTDGDLVRDTLSVTVSNFGVSGNNAITNGGLITLSGDGGQAVTLNNAGEFDTGYAANAMSLGGAAQGHLLNVQSFTNSGIIDMSAGNAAVGNVLLISGGDITGSNGTYIANGGRLILNTVLNEGGANSQSDMLVVDAARRGSAADTIKVINVGGVGAMTTGNGIELVRAQDAARSEDGAFRLSAPVISGIYEYDLHYGGVNDDAQDGNWYLRTVVTPGVDPQGNPNGTPIIPSRTGVYLRNMSSASTMFMHTLHDRLGEPQFTDRHKTEDGDRVSSMWIRVVGSKSNSSAAGGQIDLDTDTTLVHMGGDLASWSNNGDDRWHLGLMGAYGRSNTDADNGRHTANGSVDGYSVGAYATWYGNQDKPTGPYLDLWGQYAWFNNSVSGSGLQEQTYDSKGWTVSLESGYAFIARDGEQRQWMIEPQAQIAYNGYSANDYYEKDTNTWVRDGDSNGIIARLGTRLYNRSKLNDNGVQPFIEANWWYNNAKYDLSFNDKKVSDDTPNSTFELKTGLQGEIADGWQAWGHVGGRWGENGYDSYSAMVGVKYQF